MIYDVVHRTEYRFHRTVALGPHRMAFRPRDGHDMRVLATALVVEPEPQRVDLVSDVYGNSVALLLPAEHADHLVVSSNFTVDHLGSMAFALPNAAESFWIPPSYGPPERLALHPFLLPSHDDPLHLLRSWAQPFSNHGDSGGGGPRQAIAEMSAAIRNRFEYRSRQEEGVQSPLQTLAAQSGSCRDFATLMIDALRHLGIASRFVSGYLYVPQAQGVVGGGATHAWVQCYLPDCGWFPVDPTNNLIGGQELIRVAVAREASEVAPLSGAWFGSAGDFAGMTVDVQVNARSG